MRYTAKLTNSVETAKWNRVKLTHERNNTTNCILTADIFKRECKEYDEGVLPNEHELYLGERYA